MRGSMPRNCTTQVANKKPATQVAKSPPLGEVRKGGKN